MQGTVRLHRQVRPMPQCQQRRHRPLTVHPLHRRSSRWSDGRYCPPRLPNTGWLGARSSGGCALARPVEPGAVPLSAVLLSTRSSVVTNATSIAIVTATAKSTRAMNSLGSKSTHPAARQAARTRASAGKMRRVRLAIASGRQCAAAIAKRSL
jgi:hypothetical protein